MEAVKLDSKIKSAHVKKQNEEAPKPKPAPLAKRPEALHGTTYKIKTPLSEHALYVTINNLDGKPFEIFINSKCMDSHQWIAALTRMVSAIWRKGGEIDFVVEELTAIFDPKGGYFKGKGRFMPSLVAEIGYLIKAHCEGLAEDNAVTNKPVNAPQINPGMKPGKKCSHCGEYAMVKEGGCEKCTNCGEAGECG